MRIYKNGTALKKLMTENRAAKEEVGILSRLYETASKRKSSARVTDFSTSFVDERELKNRLQRAVRGAPFRMIYI